MSGPLQNDTKRAVIPVASALLLASSLALNAAQEPDFNNLKMPARDPKPVPELVEKAVTNRESVNTATKDPVRSTEKGTSPSKWDAFVEDLKRVSPFSWAALGASTAAYGFFIAQIIRNRETTWLGWVVTAANEGLMAVTSVALGTLSSAVLPIGFAICSAVAMATALKWGKKEPLTTVEKCSLGVGVAGWLLYATNLQNPVLAAWAGQIGYHASNVAFMENFYKNAGRITGKGQALFFASAVLNLCAVTKFWPLTDDLISPVGIGIGILLSTGALAAGRIKEWRERRRNETA